MPGGIVLPLGIDTSTCHRKVLNVTGLLAGQ